MNLRRLLGVFLTVLLAMNLSAQESGDAGGAQFGLDLGIGVQSFEDPATGEIEVFQSLRVTPELVVPIGENELGLGLDVTINYTFTGGENGDEFAIRRADWSPEAAELGFLELYLPKIRFIRWNDKGDSLYARFGELDRSTLGNGFLVGGYRNTVFLPEQRVAGLELDVDGLLFNFPFVGIETFVANMAVWDLIGFRIFGRPLLTLNVPIIPALEVGFTVAADSNPYYYADPDVVTIPADPDSASMFGFDVFLPILTSGVATLASFGDLAFQSGSTGAMLGVGGRLLGFLNYGAQMRFLGTNFIPSYFDSSYDAFRVSRYTVLSSDEEEFPGYVGWFASTGFGIPNFFDGGEGDLVNFTASISGPFGIDYETVDPLDERLPVLTGTLTVAELYGFSADASYIKRYLTSISEVFDPTNALVQARINYRTGAAVISLVYDLEWDPIEGTFDVTSGLESAISLF